MVELVFDLRMYPGTSSGLVLHLTGGAAMEIVLGVANYDMFLCQLDTFVSMIICDMFLCQLDTFVSMT